MEGRTLYFAWEPTFMVWLQSHLGGVSTGLISFLSNFGDEMMLVAILLYLYYCYDKKLGRYLGLNILVGQILTPFLKNIVMRRRPYFDHPEIKCLKPIAPEADLYDIAAQEYSFPSGHSSNVVLAFGSLAAGRPKVRWLKIVAVILILIVGISRMQLGVHYPTDVLFGWLLGFAVLYVMTKVQQKVTNRKLLYAVLIALALPGLFFCKTNDYFTSLGLLIGFCAGDLFEEKYVRFRNTREVKRTILRLVGGMALYLILNTLLKLPFPKEFLESATLAAHLVRTCRYTVIVFTAIAVFPLLFEREGGNGIL